MRSSNVLKQPLNGWVYGWYQPTSQVGLLLSRTQQHQQYRPTLAPAQQQGTHQFFMPPPASPPPRSFTIQQPFQQTS